MNISDNLTSPSARQHVSVKRTNPQNQTDWIKIPLIQSNSKCSVSSLIRPQPGISPSCLESWRATVTPGFKNRGCRSLMRSLVPTNASCQSKLRSSRTQFLHRVAVGSDTSAQDRLISDEPVVSQRHLRLPISDSIFGDSGEYRIVKGCFQRMHSGFGDSESFCVS